MTPEQLAQQQLFAAWLSAGAAVIQALGAIVAIWWSVKIAKDAADRERAAEAASVARAELAERTAGERQHRQDIERFNAPLDTILGLLRPALRDVRAQVQKIQDDYGHSHAHITGGYDADSLAKVRKAIQRAEEEMSDPDVLVGLNEVAALLTPYQTHSTPAAEYVAGALAAEERMIEAASRVESLKRR